MLSAELLSRAVEHSVAGAQGHAGWATHLGEREYSAPQQHLAQLAAWRRHTRRAGRPPWREMDPAEVSLRWIFGAVFATPATFATPVALLNRLPGVTATEPCPPTPAALAP